MGNLNPMEAWGGAVAERPGGTPGSPAPEKHPLVSRREVGVAVAAVGALALLGVAVGALWTAVSPHVGVVITSGGPSFQPNGGDEFYAAEGVFGLISVVMGVLSAVATWYGLRQWRGPMQLLALVLGGLAGAVVAWQLGRSLGLSQFQELLRSTDVGREFNRPVDVRAKGFLLVQPLVAAMVYVWLASWMAQPDLGQRR